MDIEDRIKKLTISPSKMNERELYYCIKGLMADYDERQRVIFSMNMRKRITPVTKQDEELEDIIWDEVRTQRNVLKEIGVLTQILEDKGFDLGYI